MKIDYCVIVKVVTMNLEFVHQDGHHYPELVQVLTVQFHSKCPEM
jgi:hypothetical protein